ncbi:MAG: hypothetical protein ACC655_01910 [Rhodothermia bacterium]
MKSPNFFAAALAVLLVLLQAVTLSAQAPRTISHQGRLTDSGGTPVADASRSMTFNIYNVASGGTALWTETKNVGTVGGVFNTILGSPTPITGVDFNQPLWLGIKVASDPEISTRTALTSNPSAFGLVMPFTDRFEIETKNLGVNGSEGVNEDLTIRASDAQIGLYSDAIGGVGSGIQMGEINSGALVNKWSIFRGTTGGDASLYFTFGDLPSYPLNPTRVKIDTSGGLLAMSSSVATFASGVRGEITSTSPGTNSSGILGVNFSSTTSGFGVSGNHLGAGVGVYGGTLGGGTGVFGQSLAEGGTGGRFEGFEQNTTFDPDIELAGLGIITSEGGMILRPTISGVTVALPTLLSHFKVRVDTTGLPYFERVLTARSR